GVAMVLRRAASACGCCVAEVEAVARDKVRGSRAARVERDGERGVSGRRCARKTRDQGRAAEWRRRRSRLLRADVRSETDIRALVVEVRNVDRGPIAKTLWRKREVAGPAVRRRRQREGGGVGRRAD